MIVPFAKRVSQVSPATPLDFYRFRHRDEKIYVPEKKTLIARPLWIVGVSPFDPVIAEDGGHVVHLGAPRFTARWSMNDDIIGKIPQPDFYDEELNIIIYEVLFIDKHPGQIDGWLLEAACAVAYSKGLIAAVDPEEMH